MRHTVKLLALALALIICTVLFFGRSLYARECEVLVLCYHHLGDTGNDSTIITPETFDSQLSLLLSHGYKPISVSDMTDFVYGRKILPEKCVVVTFDDGYESNLTLALPVLKKYGVPATVFMIGAFAGTDSYKNTGKPMIRHFSFAEAAEVYGDGLVGFGSHSYDMHMYTPLESGVCRSAAVRLDGESEAEFFAAFSADHEAMCALMRTHLGYTPESFAYPHGLWDPIAEEILKNSGVRVTFTTSAHTNILRRKDADCLCLMGRYTVCEATDLESVLECDIHKNQGETQ